MTNRGTFRSIVVVAVLAISLASSGEALARSGCGGYMTVQPGDTLTSIAALCGTTVSAIQAANPGIGGQLSPGKVIYVPGVTGSTSATPVGTPRVGGTYVVQRGDTMGGIALLFGVSFSDLMTVNPQITNPSLIYPGQVINLPASAGTVTPVPTSCACATATPTPTSQRPALDYSQFRGLRVIYGHGLIVRTGPARTFSEIKSPLVSAVVGSTWLWRKGSITVDKEGFTWVEVALPVVVNGRSTGWIVVKDGLGNFYTRPNIPNADP